tara:strand:- start:135 stop:263 length:129 start_codon:yes stop_codon:yes gene_type:complete
MELQKIANKIKKNGTKYMLYETLNLTLLIAVKNKVIIANKKI